MTIAAARKWLALYFLLTVVVTGLYLLLFATSQILPLRRDEANASFQILIPVLVGQVTVIFQWISRANTNDPDNVLPSPIPSWAIKLPPALALVIVISAAVTLIVANNPGSHLTMGPDGFKNAITFAVSILNASTVLLVARLFPSKKD